MNRFSARLGSFAVTLTLTLALCTPLAAAADAVAVADAIKAGGVVLLIRHASAPGIGDPKKFSVDDCPAQRNLPAEGPEEAKRVGAHLKPLGLTPGAIYTSQRRRCREVTRP